MPSSSVTAIAIMANTGCLDRLSTCRVELQRMASVLHAGVLQLINKSYLHYALMPGQPVPEWLSIMQQQPPRHRVSAASGAAEFSLFSFTKDMAYAGKQVVNSQVIQCVNKLSKSVQEQYQGKPVEISAATSIPWASLSVGDASDSCSFSATAPY